MGAVAALLISLLLLMPFTYLLDSLGRIKLPGAFEKLGRGRFYGPHASTGSWGRRSLWKMYWRISLIQVLLK